MLPLCNSQLPSASIPEVGMWAKPLQIKYKNILEVLNVVPYMPVFGKSGQSFTTGFKQLQKL